MFITYPDSRRPGMRPSLIANVIIRTWSATMRYAASTRPLSSVQTVPLYSEQSHSWQQKFTEILHYRHG